MSNPAIYHISVNLNIIFNSMEHFRDIKNCTKCKFQGVCAELNYPR